MTKRTNRVAWGLSGLLAVALVGGIGLMLNHGVEAGPYGLSLVPFEQWRFGSRLMGGAFCDRRRGTSTLVIGGREVDFGPLVVRVRKR